MKVLSRKHLDSIFIFFGKISNSWELDFYLKQSRTKAGTKRSSFNVKANRAHIFVENFSFIAN